MPCPRSQAAPAYEALAFESIKILGLGPLADHVAIGHDDHRGLGRSLHQADRLSRLDDKRLILIHGGQCTHDGIICGLVARRLPECCVDDEVFRVFTDSQHVFHKAQQGFLPPALRAKLWA